MSTFAARLVIICALVGLGASVAAAYVHYHLLSDPRYISFCDVNATVSCAQVYQSRFSTVRGIPVAIFGGIWFAVAALLGIGGLVARPAVRESIPGYLFVGSTLALAVSLYLAYASFFLIKAVCIVCLVTYAAVIGLFGASAAATSLPMTSLPRRALHDFRVFISSPLAVTLAVIVFAGAGSALAFFPREAVTVAGEPVSTPVATENQRSEFERWYASQPRTQLAIPSEGAKVLVVKFNDYQCPACGQSYAEYKPIFAKFEAEQPGAVRLVMKDFPLNADCNPGATRTMHAAACAAAVAARLARQHDRVEAMEEWLYTHQPGMTVSSVRDAARDVGQVPDFDAQYARTVELVKGDAALGTELRVQSTPTFFVNGVKIDGSLPAQYFEQALAIELGRAK